VEDVPRYELLSQRVSSATPGAKPPNENKISDGYRERASIEVRVFLITGKRDRAAGSCSLHRLVRCAGESNIFFQQADREHGHPPNRYSGLA